jgi:hypothetical protein
MFENAVDAIVSLKILGVDAIQAQKFVRLCLADNNGAMQLSKNKRYFADILLGCQEPDYIIGFELGTGKLLLNLEKMGC